PPRERISFVQFRSAVKDPLVLRQSAPFLNWCTLLRSNLLNCALSAPLERCRLIAATAVMLNSVCDCVEIPRNRIRAVHCLMAARRQERCWLIDARTRSGMLSEPVNKQVDG